MGYSMSQAASKALDRLQDACHAQGKSSNVYVVNGERYFFELSPRDQPDNGARGAIQKFVGENLSRKVGTFHIDGDGKVVRGPKFFKDVLAAAEGMEGLDQVGRALDKAAGL